jgi:alpha 1,3-glucosidase
MAKSAILFSLLMICLAVKRHEFKTCKDLGFCQRSRLLARQSSLKVQYSVLESSISDSPTGVQFYLRSEANPSFHLKTRISHLENNILSVQIEEEAASRKRYSDQSDLVFNKTALRYLPNVKKLQNGLEWSQGQFKYVLSFKPFNIQGFVQDVLVYVVNDRNLLNFERTRNKDESCVKKDEFIQDSTCLDGDFQLWEEKWSSFVDPNVFGPSSVGIDVTWVNTENVYGIPEHADSLALRDTENDEPYRLYNLDVFEYELNERMALYGSVPFMISKQGGFFWNNPSETWVDIGSSSSKLGWLTGDSKPSKRTHWFSETGVIELYLFLGLTPIDLVQKFTIFTGPALFPPMFAISYHQCRWNYYTQKELLEVEQGFEDHNLPVDVLWLDIEHTPHRQYFLWDYSSFPSPKDMLNHLASHGRKLVNIVDPHMSKRSGYHVNKIFENKGKF